MAHLRSYVQQARGVSWVVGCVEDLRLNPPEPIVINCSSIVLFHPYKWPNEYKFGRLGVKNFTSHSRGVIRFKAYLQLFFLCPTVVRCWLSGVSWGVEGCLVFLASIGLPGCRTWGQGCHCSEYPCWDGETNRCRGKWHVGRVERYGVWFFRGGGAGAVVLRCA